MEKIIVEGKLNPVNIASLSVLECPRQNQLTARPSEMRNSACQSDRQ